MSPTELFEKFGRLRPGFQNGHKTRHKPLLVLLALGRWEKGNRSPVAFKDIETKLENLITTYSPGAVGYPEIPFWRLKHDGVWELGNTGHLARPNAEVPPTAVQMQEVTGQFAKTVREVLSSDGTLPRRLAVAVLEMNFPAGQHAAIAGDVELDLNGLLPTAVTADVLPDCPLPEEAPENVPLVEGAVRTVLVNAYERNPEARRLCIAHHGTACCVCGFDFGKTYGPLADSYIHVHHLRPLSEVGGEYEVDPIEDLRPVCPNCHAVIHIGGGLRSIEEVKELLRKTTSS